jgi:hypothetical protein
VPGEYNFTVRLAQQVYSTIFNAKVSENNSTTSEAGVLSAIYVQTHYDEVTRGWLKNVAGDQYFAARVKSQRCGPIGSLRRLHYTVSAGTEGVVDTAVGVKTRNDSRRTSAPTRHYDLPIRLKDNIRSFLGSDAEVEEDFAVVTEILI